MTTQCDPIESGYSLTELLFVLAIIAVLTAIAAPALATKTQQMRALSEESAFLNALQLARIEAMKEGLPVQLCVSIDGVTCSTASNWQRGWIAAQSNSDGTLHAVLQTQKAFAGADTLTAKNNVSSVTFGRDGFISGFPSDGVMFTLASQSTTSSTTRCFIIADTGEPTNAAVNPQTGTC
jgi:type IV fimbrial biogenesis protein FimT